MEMMKNDKKFKIKLVLLWVFAFSVIMFLMSLTANAQGNSLPFIVANENIDGFENFINTLPYSTASSGASYFVDAYNNDNYFGYDYYENGIHKFAFYVPQEEFTYSFYLSNDYSDFDITVDYADFTFSNYIFITGYTQPAPRGGYYFYGSYQTTPINQSRTVRFFYGSNKGDGSLLVPNISSQNYNYQLNIYQPVFGLSVVNPPIEIGTAILPPSAFVPDYPTGTNPPSTVPPTYTPQTYTPTTPPTPDFSTAEKTLESIYNYIVWGIADINGQFHLLKDNLSGFFEYIGLTIQYYGNAIIDTLNNFIQNFYDNMKNLVEPIYNDLNELKQSFLDFADLFIHPFDEEEFEDQMESCELINQYEELMDNCEVLQQIFDYAEERDYFVLYIDFENPFADSEHKIIHSEISFTWLKDYRSTYRPFLWVFTMLECFIGGMRLLGGIIGGKAK